MNKTAHVYTDGSCVALEHKSESGARGYGGWCAVVEHGSEGWVLRGRELWTTACRMELQAVIDGLRSLPDRCAVRLFFDCTVILSIRDRLDREIPFSNVSDFDLWEQVASEFGRLHVELRLIEKRERVGQHQRAHTFAGAEARALREETRGLADRQRAV